MKVSAKRRKGLCPVGAEDVFLKLQTLPISVLLSSIYCSMNIAFLFRLSFLISKVPLFCCLNLYKIKSGPK